MNENGFVPTIIKVINIYNTIIILIVLRTANVFDSEPPKVWESDGHREKIQMPSLEFGSDDRVD